LKELDSTEGTVTLVDGTPSHYLLISCADSCTAAHQFKDKGNTDIVLIPQPSDDINDPLNWPSWKKTLAFAPIVIFTALGTWVIGGVGTALVLLMIEFQKDLNETATGLISWSVLAFGAGVRPRQIVKSDFLELFLGSCGTLFWKETCFSRFFFSFFRHNYMVRQSDKL
jgi:hypothetical protein